MKEKLAIHKFMIGIGLFSLGYSLTALAEIHQWKDSNGVTHFSDQIPKNQKTKVIEMPFINTTTFPPEEVEVPEDPEVEENTVKEAEEELLNELAKDAEVEKEESQTAENGEDEQDPFNPQDTLVPVVEASQPPPPRKRK